jgi:hypothetical protein
VRGCCASEPAEPPGLPAQRRWRAQRRLATSGPSRRHSCARDRRQSLRRGHRASRWRRGRRTNERTLSRHGLTRVGFPRLARSRLVIAQAGSGCPVRPDRAPGRYSEFDFRVAVDAAVSLRPVAVAVVAVERVGGHAAIAARAPGSCRAALPATESQRALRCSTLPLGRCPSEAKEAREAQRPK